MQQAPPIRTIAREVLKIAKFARCPVRHRKMLEIVSRELGLPISQDEYFAAIETLGKRVIRVHGAEGSVCV